MKYLRRHIWETGDLSKRLCCLLIGSRDWLVWSCVFPAGKWRETWRRSQKRPGNKEVCENSHSLSLSFIMHQAPAAAFDNIHWQHTFITLYNVWYIIRFILYISRNVMILGFIYFPRCAYLNKQKLLIEHSLMFLMILLMTVIVHCLPGFINHKLHHNIFYLVNRNGNTLEEGTLILNYYFFPQLTPICCLLIVSK